MLLALLCVTVGYAVLRAVKCPERAAIAVAIVLAILVRILFPSLTIGSWGWIVLAVVLIQYWLGPILVYGTAGTPVVAPVELFDPRRHQVPESVEEPRQSLVNSLRALGFAPFGELYMTGHMPNMTVRLTVLDNVATRQRATAIGLWSTPLTGDDAPMVQQVAAALTYTEVISYLSDGRTVVVHNSPQIGAFPSVPQCVVEVFPELRDLAVLARVHRGLTEQVRGHARAEASRGREEPVQYLARSIREELERQIGTGYYRIDRQKGTFRITAKGALLMTWKLLPPFAGLRRERTLRRADMLLRTFGAGGDEPQSRRNGSRAAAPWLAAGILILALAAAKGRSLVPGILPTLSASEAGAGPSIPADFPGAIHALERLAGAPSTPFVVTDSVGRRRRVDGAVVSVQADRAEDLLAMHQRFAERGFYLFRLDQNYGIGGQSDAVALVPTLDPYEVVRLVGTSGPARQVATPAVVEWLRTLERDEPFLLTGIGLDHMQGRFMHPIRDPVGVARRVYTLCPDMVDQGTGSVEALADEIRRMNGFSCWWDG